MRFDAAIGRRPRGGTLWAGIGVCMSALLAAWGAIALSGTKIGPAIALSVVFGPIALYGAIAAPLIFPFGIFLIAVPFDNLLAFSSFGTLTKILGIACAAAMILWLVRTKRFVVPDRSLLGWAAFVVFAVCSFGWAVDPVRGIPDVATLCSLFGLYAVVSFMPVDRRTLGIVAATIVAGGTLAGLYGGYLFHHGVAVSTDGRLAINAGSQSIDPNHFAAALLVPLVLVLSTIVESRNLRVRLAAAFCGAIIVLGMLLAASRGAIVAAAVMYVYLLFRSQRRLVLAGIGIAAVSVGLAAFANIAQRFSDAAASGGAGRLGIWRVGLAAFKNHPLAGAGLGNFALAYNDAFLTVPAFASMKVIEGARWNVAPHNNLIWIAVELGTIGLLAYLGAWWLQFRALRAIVPGNNLYPMRIAVEAALVGQFTAGLFLGTVTYKYVWLAFMLAALTRNAAYCAERRVS